MLEFATFSFRQKRWSWPLEDGEPSQRPLKRLRRSDWWMFIRGGARPDDLLAQLRDKESFHASSCSHCGAVWDFGYGSLDDAGFQIEIQTEFGPVHAYTAEDTRPCSRCFPSKMVSPAGTVVYAIRAVPSVLVLSLDFRYVPGQSLTAIATAISGREVGRHVQDLHWPSVLGLNIYSYELRQVARLWAQEAGLLQSPRQRLVLIVGFRLLSFGLVVWSERAERGPPRFRLRSKANLGALRWQRYMEVLRQPSVRAVLDVRPEDMA